jgi:hypothetical protein
MTGGKRNPPFGLDMPFDEALERYAGVISSELAISQRSVPQPKGSTVLTWVKKLSTTDAQQVTTGGKVPYLRLTKGTISQGDWHTWFRNTFFANAAWAAGTVKNEPVEQVTIPFEVTIKDVKLGPQAMTVTHQPERAESHSAPDTWIHWSVSLRDILEANDFTGRPVRLTRDDSGIYHLDIDAAADA